MNSREEAQYNMQNQTKKFLDDTTEKWSTIMLRYKLVDPIFYEGYERSRVIVG